MEQVKDSIQIGDITVYNSFKHQILANKGNTYDSTLILDKVYKRHQKLWDGCYAMIFGEENASKFKTEVGMVKWNKALYKDNKEFMEQRVRELLQQNVDSILKESLSGFTTLIDKHRPTAKISIVFVPLQGVTFGGCDQSMFVLDLMDTSNDLNYVLTKGFPHEINHLAYEPTRKHDPDRKTALLNTIDEGLACYYTYKFFKGDIPKRTAVENMSEEDWNWYLQHEKEIFVKSRPYLLESSEKVTPYSCSCGMHRGKKLFEDAPHSICYWLGFRIIESYERNNGVGSWKDVYELPAREVLAKSGYENYINSLKE
ncbi:hypothetical protein I2I11_20415 [Pontibacter sp. 172403-2]|nr:hypothetical protein [Pontibacter sp. 172403-2]